MYFFALFVLFWTGSMVNSEKHSLTYIYTALSKPVTYPGIHQFTAMGLLDDEIIDYFDSVKQKKEPKQKWMEKNMEKGYWEKGTLSRQSKQQWFTVNINILKERLRQNDSDLHILQWRHGCEGDWHDNGQMKFVRGMDMYSYDGDDFLSFDNSHAVWVAPVNEAKETKRKWDDVDVLKQYTKGYLENECIKWLKDFVNYSREELKTGPAPDVYPFIQKSKVEGNMVLTCLATGFHSKNIVLRIKSDDRVLTEKDGVQSSGVRPNEDNTFQRRDHVEIVEKELAKYTCEVVHPPSGFRVQRIWEPPRVFPVVAVAAGVGILLMVGVVGLVLVLLRRRLAGCKFTKGPGQNINVVVIPASSNSSGGVASISDPLLNGVKGAPPASDASSQSSNSSGGVPSISVPLLNGSEGSLDSGVSSKPDSTSESGSERKTSVAEHQAENV
uniref:class I histocompatibility antigen, F10 alpha chain-like isoform X2 n=1 Tax=Scatophagus argus TaxID=75038 RepID=UPI001ED8193E|nr:class I histocompatibility antigen, F10 alpha chain-like isoform X2 [Scatophagus argus]